MFRNSRHGFRHLCYAGLFIGSAIGADSIVLTNGSRLDDVQITNQSATTIEYIDAPGKQPKTIAKAQVRRLLYQEVDWKAKELAQLRARVAAARQRLEELQKAAASDPGLIVKAQSERLRKFPVSEKSRLDALRTRIAELESARRELARPKPGLRAPVLEDLRRRRTANAKELTTVKQDEKQLRRKLTDDLLSLAGQLEDISAQLDRAVTLLQKQKTLTAEDGATNRMERDVLLAESAHARTLQDRAYRGSLWRSFLLPGWGQIYREETVRGRIITGAFGISFLYMLHTRSEAAAALQAYRDPGPAIASVSSTNALIPAALYYSDRGASYRAKNLAFSRAVLLLPAIWLGGLIDTAFFLEMRAPVPDGVRRNKTAFFQQELNISARLTGVDWRAASSQKRETR